MVTCLDRALDIAVGRRAALVEGGLDRVVDDGLAGIAQFAPLGDALARETEFLIGSGPSVRTADTRLNASPMGVGARDLAALLRRVDLIGHAQLGALDDGEAVGLRLVRGLSSLA